MNHQACVPSPPLITSFTISVATCWGSADVPSKCSHWIGFWGRLSNHRARIRTSVIGQMRANGCTGRPSETKHKYCADLLVRD